MSYQDSSGNWRYPGSTQTYASQGAANYYGPRDSQVYQPTSSNYQETPASPYVKPVEEQVSKYGPAYLNSGINPITGTISPEKLETLKTGYLPTQMVNAPPQDFTKKTRHEYTAEEARKLGINRIFGGADYRTERRAERKAANKKAREEAGPAKDNSAYMFGVSKYANAHPFGNFDFGRSQEEENKRDVVQSQNTLYEVGFGGQVNYTPAGQKTLHARDERRETALQQDAFTQKFGFKGPSTVEITHGSTVHEQKNYYKPMTDLGTTEIKPSPYLKIGEKIPGFNPNYGENKTVYKTVSYGVMFGPEQPKQESKPKENNDFFSGAKASLENLINPVLAIPSAVSTVLSGKGKPTGLLGLPGVEPPKSNETPLSNILSGKSPTTSKGQAYDIGSALTDFGLIIAPTGLGKAIKGTPKVNLPEPPKIPSSSSILTGGGSSFSSTKINLGTGTLRVIKIGDKGGTLTTNTKKPGSPSDDEVDRYFESKVRYATDSAKAKGYDLVPIKKADSGKTTYVLLKKPIVKEKPLTETKTTFKEYPIQLGKSKIQVIPKTKPQTFTTQVIKPIPKTTVKTKSQLANEKYLADLQILRQRQKTKQEEQYGYVYQQTPKQKTAQQFQPIILQQLKTGEMFKQPQILKEDYKPAFKQPQAEKSAVSQILTPKTSQSPILKTQPILQEKQTYKNPPIQKQIQEQPKYQTPMSRAGGGWGGLPGGAGGGGRKHAQGSRKVYTTYAISAIIPRGQLAGPYQRVSSNKGIYKELTKRDVRSVKGAYKQAKKNKSKTPFFL